MIDRLFKKRSAAQIVPPAERWKAFAWLAWEFASGQKTATESRMRAQLRQAFTVAPLGVDGATNPCRWLREEVALRLDPPRVPPRLRIGVDMDAMTADNRELIKSLAEQVLALTAGDAR